MRQRRERDKNIQAFLLSTPVCTPPAVWPIYGRTKLRSRPQPREAAVPLEHTAAIRAVVSSEWLAGPPTVGTLAVLVPTHVPGLKGNTPAGKPGERRPACLQPAMPIDWHACRLLAQTMRSATLPRVQVSSE